MKPSDMEKLITDTMAESCRVMERTAETLAPAIAQVSALIAETIRSGRKVMICGNGGSAADAQHMAAELVGRFQKERPAWPAIALSTDTSILTSVGNDYGFDNVFARQVQALGQAGDVLIGITTSGNSPNVVAAVKAASGRDMTCVALTGQGGGVLAQQADHLLAVPSPVTARVQESHGAIIHLICEIVENILSQEA
jgi:D-sedoheptulose 7-phosphate isomerase